MKNTLASLPVIFENFEIQFYFHYLHFCDFNFLTKSPEPNASILPAAPTGPSENEKFPAGGTGVSSVPNQSKRSMLLLCTCLN